MLYESRKPGFANQTLRNNPRKQGSIGSPAKFVSHEVHNAGALSGLEHRARLTGITGEGFLAQNMTAA